MKLTQPPTGSTSVLFERLWPIYLTLRGQTGQGHMLPNPVSLVDMDMYARTFDAGFVAWERQLILEADALYLAAVTRQLMKQNSKGQSHG